MWNLVKNIIRSLSKNKISIIGLTFLVFLSVGLFTVLKSTTTNIDGTYNTVSMQGNQHDFTISENYTTGYVKMIPGNKDDTLGVGTSSDNQTIPWPTQSGPVGETYTKIYYYKLDAVLDGDTLIDQFYTEHYNDAPTTDEYKLIYRSFTVENSNQLTYMDNEQTHKSSKNYGEIQQELAKQTTTGLPDSSIISTELANWSSELVEYVSEKNSPLHEYLSTELNNEVYFRNFSSLKINNSIDNIFYDVVQSLPADSNHKYESIVDREIIFNNEQFNNLGWNNFSNDDWKPSDLIKSRDEIKSALSYNEFPSSTDFEQYWQKLLENKDEQKIVAEKFNILAKGLCSEGTPDIFITTVRNINQILETGKFEEIKDSLKQFINSGCTLHDVNDKKYAFALTYEHSTVPFTWSLNDWTAHFGVFAPQYLQANNKMPLDIHSLMQSDQDYLDWIQKHGDIVDERQQFIGWMNSLSESELNQKFDTWKSTYSDNVINVGGSTPCFILAAGITGDYVYPVVSIERPIPNPKSECIYFCNESGYQRIFASFQTNQTEKYVVGKFIHPNKARQILNQINDKCREIMSWPENIKAAYMADDTSCTLNAAAFRIVYIKKLVSKIDLISYLLTVFVLVLGLLISGIIVSRYVGSNRVTIGVMRANGISKWAIALSLIPFAFIPSLIGGICGYVVGTSLQSAAIGLFSVYWTLPTTILSFSWLSLFISLILPFAIFTVVSIISTFIILRKKTTELMKQGSEYKANFLARMIKKPISKFGIIFKFRFSVALSSFGKLFILTLISSLAMSSLVFGFTINNKFETAISKTLETRKYQFAIDLYSPTSQGGQYVPTSQYEYGTSGSQGDFNTQNIGLNFIPSCYISQEVGLKFGESNPWKDISDDTARYIDLYRKNYYDTTFITVDGLHFDSDATWYQKGFCSEDGQKTYSNLFVPLMSDAVGQKIDLQYLKNRSSSKLTMNYLIGLSVLGLASNPWDIAAALMPENIKNTANAKYDALINSLGEKVYSDGAYKNYEKFFNRTELSDDKYSYALNQSNVIDYTGMALNRDYLELISKAYNTDLLDLSEPETNAAKNDYKLIYNSIPLSSTEETYTYLTGNAISSTSKKLPENAKIVGIDNNTKYINLINEDGENLISLLNWKEKYQDNVYPMVVNELTSNKYNLKVGSEIAFDITNKADRFQNQIENIKDESPARFKVVGICQSREGEEYFIDQQIANYILGLRSKYGEQINDQNYLKLHDYYINYAEATKDTTFTVGTGLQTKAAWNDIFSGEGNDGAQLTTGKQLKTKNENLNILPYGFNGYFTDDENGSKGLTSGYSFYSPSGLWLPSSSITSNSSLDVLSYGSNLQIANIFTGINKTELGQQIEQAYNDWQENPSDEQLHNKLTYYVQTFQSEIANIWTDTSYVSLVSGAMDINSNQTVFKSMSDTITQIETIVLVIISLMVFFIVLLIASMVIGDSKKLAAILSSLGYTDAENAISFMSIYIPVVLLGLLISFPLTLGLVHVFQQFVMNGVSLLLDVSTRWFYYLVAAGAICVEFGASVFFSWISLKKSSLVDMIK